MKVSADREVLHHTGGHFVDRGDRGASTIGVSATNASSPGYTGSASASYLIAAPLVVKVSTDLSIYSWKQKVVATAVVTSGTSSVAGATVTFTIAKPDGQVVSATVQTATNGSAAYIFRCGRRDSAGVYRVSATASNNGMTATISTSLTLQ